MAEPTSDAASRGTTPTVAIVGAGIAGLCMGIRLKQAGIHTFTIFEKADRIGGTWRDNSYPGAACDVPSHLYSFSFEPNPDWTHKFSAQAEIEAYFQHCAEKYGILPHCRFGVEIVEARFDESAHLWRLRTRDGEAVVAQVVVSGTGQLNRPHIPAIPGLDGFAGTTFHSARWRHDLDLTGRNVAVVGNGASAVQFIPRVAPAARRLTVYQRSANWIFPRLDRRYADRTRWLFRHVPGLQRLYRDFIYLAFESHFFWFFKKSWFAKRLEKFALDHMRGQIHDPRLHEALTPDYPIGCKRILISDDFFPALERPNVQVVRDAVVRVTPEAVVTADGTERPTDVIIFGTGFDTMAFLAPMAVAGRHGATLAETWRDGAEAYLGVAVAGFPNLFLLYGPNTNLGHNSIIFMIECQVGYVLQCVQELMRRGVACLDVRPGAMAEYNRRLQQDIKRTTWDGGCTSWYKTESGKITNNWSGFTLQYWRRTRRPDWAAFAAL